MKNIVISFLLLLSLIFSILTGCNKESGSFNTGIHHVRDSVLDIHPITRITYDSTYENILLGNEDMGGLMKHDGLGFGNLWLSDNWKNSTQRAPLHGLFFKSDIEVDEYNQHLDLKTGVITTIWKNEEKGYKSEVFFSKANKDLLIMNIKNLSGNELHLSLLIPVQDFEARKGIIYPTEKKAYKTKEVNDKLIIGSNDANSFTRVFWAAKSSQPIKKDKASGQYNISIPGKATLEFVFSVATHWDGENFANRCLNSLYGCQDIELARKAHEQAWKDEWQKTPVISIPDKRHEQLFYRSVFWTLCAGAAEHFLPGEAQYASYCWSMIPFTYGAAGWTVRSLTLLGHEDKARHMAREHFKPLALRSNAAKYLDYIQNNQYKKFWEYPEMPIQDVDYYMDEGTDSLLVPAFEEQSMGFAHQISYLGDCRIRRAHQRTINGFAAAFYHLISDYYPDKVFTLQYTYPVIKSTAIFWEKLVEWNDTISGYILPNLHSVSENLTKRSVLDAVLAAKWNLMMASRYANELEVDTIQSKKWAEIANKLYIPQNDKNYLEYLFDDEQREGSGYFGIRAPALLGFPGYELVSMLDKEKALITLDKAWERNKNGEGMITFVANWFALTEASFGRGNKCLEILERNFECLDETGTVLYEVEKRHPYFQTSYATYIQAVLSMLVQSYNDTARVFPAVPDAWKDIRFYNIHVENGVTVSGELSDGKIKKIIFSKDGKVYSGKKAHEIQQVLQMMVR